MAAVKYLSICSGIEAASVAWESLGWTPLAFSEIEAFPRAVLAHHYPDVPLHGDFTKLRDEAFISDADVLVGGTPCQAFSVAGLRNSLADDRGNLSLEFVRLADAIDDVRHAAERQPAIIVWENVPGVLSVKDNAFGCFLAGLAGDVTPYVPPRGKWTDAGVVAGPQRAVAWRVLDAQYFGLAQRRRRVFVVASAREGFDPAAVLLEFEGVRRDSPPRREARQDAAADAAPGTGERRSHWDGVEHPHPTLNQPFNTGAIGYSNQELFSQRGAGLVGEASTGEISHCLNAGGMGRQDYETETLVTHALRGEGFDASEDGTGRGTPLVPVAFSAKDHGADATADLSPTLRAMPHNESHANGGGQMAVAVPLLEVGKRTGPSSTDDKRVGLGIGADGDPMFTLQAGAQHGVATVEPYTLAIRGRGDTHNLEARQDGLANALLTPNGGRAGIGVGAVAAGMAVRRLTPVECERLQGFPDGYTMIPWKKKPAAECPDGPRYKALGNSMAVPCMAWIGRRIAAHLAETTFRQPEGSCPERSVKHGTKENENV
jgi:DNA (cytosine-5)-methyltransferase 1